MQQFIMGYRRRALLDRPRIGRQVRTGTALWSCDANSTSTVETSYMVAGTGRESTSHPNAIERVSPDLMGNIPLHN